MFKRIALFLVTNMIVMVVGSIVISLVMNAFGISYYDGVGGYNYASLAVICAVWGMVGSFVSLLMSKFMAKRFYGVQIVDEDPHYRELVQTVHQYAKDAGLEKMPEVGVYPSDEINAFATGPSRNNSLVAVSEGLLRRMGKNEVEGVLAHEIAHIANGDMVTMALVQGIVNAFVMFLSEIATKVIDNFFKDDNGRGGLGFFGYFIVRNILHIAFGILTAPIVYWFSRYREYRADEGGAKIAGKEKMIAALEALKINYPQLAEATAQQERGQENFKTMQISSKIGMNVLFSTHPTLDDRINALRNQA